MKNFLVITGVAISLFASSTALARGEGAVKGATKVKEVVIPKVETKGAKSEVKMNSETSAKEARGAKTATTASLEDSAAAVEASVDEARNAGAVCSADNLEKVSLAQQTLLNEAAGNGTITSATCFGNGKIQDADAIDNGINTVAAASSEAKAQGASKALKVRVLNSTKKAAIATRALFTFAKETGRSTAEAKADFVQVCKSCLGMEPSVCSAL